MNDAVKTGSVTWKWIAWFVLMPLPFPFYNLFTYFYLLILTPATLIPAYFTDPFFESSRYVDWRYWGISFACAAFNFLILQYIISYHDNAKVEGRKTDSIISCGAAALMIFGYAALYMALQASSG